jgi:hypothetical protein
MKKIVWPPKPLENFTRCECDYSLLDLQDGRYAIEWALWEGQGGDIYAVVYEMREDAKDDFEKLRNRGISYRAIEERTSPENILPSPPWVERDWETRAKIVEKVDGFWNYIVIDQQEGEFVHIGPYESIDEATKHLLEDSVRVSQQRKTAEASDGEE